MLPAYTKTPSLQPRSDLQGLTKMLRDTMFLQNEETRQVYLTTRSINMILPQGPPPSKPSKRNYKIHNKPPRRTEASHSLPKVSLASPYFVSMSSSSGRYAHHRVATSHQNLPWATH